MSALSLSLLLRDWPEGGKINEEKEKSANGKTEAESRH